MLSKLDLAETAKNAAVLLANSLRTDQIKEQSQCLVIQQLLAYMLTVDLE